METLIYTQQAKITKLMEKMQHWSKLRQRNWDKKHHPALIAHTITGSYGIKTDIAGNVDRKSQWVKRVTQTVNAKNLSIKMKP